MDPNKEKKLLTELKLAREKIKLFQRDAEIEAALDRVRACSMAMHYSSELIEVVQVLDQAIKGLGIQNIDATQIITDFTDPDKGLNVWIAVENMNYLEKFHIPALDHPALSNHFKAVREKINFYTEKYPKAENARLFKLLFKYSDFKSIPEYRKEVLLNSPGLVRSVVIHNNSALIFQHNGLDEFSEEANAIFKRFGVVFEQAYTRFIDLQKAEEQALEAQIEAALERVRGRVMAIQESSELRELIALIFDEVRSLGLELYECNIVLIDRDAHEITLWGHGWENVKLPISYKIVPWNHPFLNEALEDFDNGVSYRTFELGGKSLQNYYDVLFRDTEFKNAPQEYKDSVRDIDQVFGSHAMMTYGALEAIGAEPLTEDKAEILKRFAKVVDFTYTRFEDVKQAEQQAREAQIEAALERVRTKGMSMQSTDEIESATKIVFNELSRLGIEMERCGITLLNETPIAELWSTTLSQKSKEVIDIVTGYLDFRIHPLFQKSYQDWKENKRYSNFKLEGDKVQKYYSVLEKQPEYKFPTVANYPDQQILHSFFFNVGAIFVYTPTEMPDESKRIIQRFTKVFEQTYTRFLDIQRAEKLALETARQASLDRIRAEIASMRSAEDLNQITPIIWDELKTLEIPFIRCGVFIIDEENGISHTYLSTSRGEPIAALNLPLTEFPLLKNSMKSWKNREIYTVHWDEQDFRDWSQSLIDGGFIQSKKKYSAGSVPETLDLHFLPFKHGMLYIGNTEPLSEKELDLGQSLASAFSVAYDRYEDFNKLEKAFRELEEAKDQLVQQEKLASLGQLTAGIAHEIKNPLNFVNNFSDLSIELLDEAREEVKELLTTDNSQLTAILNDVEANLKKIHEHGIRADRIVKSMLQHSRGGSGKMEPTDLNALIKEYVNLAFHGMRAGKDPIDVDVQLQLDENVGEVSLIAEDFSRVILNLCNNAFDAMSEKLSENAIGKSEKPPFEEPVPTPREGADPSADGEVGDVAVSSYQPKLTIRTVRNRDTVTIDVQDNGSGIPEEIKDKILQPFFTTKKGTAGTGLGLSITNDIIKAHGGSLNIQSDSNGSTFIVSMPL